MSTTPVRLSHHVVGHGRRTRGPKGNQRAAMPLHNKENDYADR